jgi:amino acid transporter, AAT family
VGDHGVPVRSILVTLVCLILGVLLNFMLPERIFAMMMSILAFNTVWTWSMVLIAHFSFRRKQTTPSAFPLRLWPLSSVVCLAFFAFVMFMLGYSPDTRVALYVGVAWVLLLSVAYQGLGVKRRMAVEQ